MNQYKYLDLLKNVQFIRVLVKKLFMLWSLNYKLATTLLALTDVFDIE